MELLISRKEVAEMAFGDSSPYLYERINETSIIFAQEKYIKPLLGEMYVKLYEQNNRNFLSEYVKPALALFVKFAVLNSLSVSVGSSGVVKPEGDYLKSADAGHIAALKKEALSEGYVLRKRMITHLEENKADYPDYVSNEKLLNAISRCTTIVM